MTFTSFKHFGGDMAGCRKGPRMIKEILRLKALGLGSKKIALALDISKNTVKKYIRAHENGVAPPEINPEYQPLWSEFVDWIAVKKEIDRGVSLSVWWEENIKIIETGDLAGVTYSSFWREWQRRYPRISLSFHKYHPPGERCEIDFKGKDADFGYVDRESGDFIPCRLFGSILCFSQMFYAEATRDEKQESLFQGIANSFSYFGGVPHTIIFDNAKTATVKAHIYDPELNQEYVRLCEHFNTAPIQARPRKPKDKNLIENVLGVFWRWAWPKIKAETYYSLSSLNGKILELLAIFVKRTQKKYGTSREEKFLSGEKEKLRPLPERAFEFGKWQESKVHQDSHIQVGYNFYSVPYTARGKSVDVRVSAHFIEVYCTLERIALHQRFPPNQRGQYRTIKTHLPQSHQAILEATPQKIMSQAKMIGPETGELVRSVIEDANHPLRYLRRAQAITTRLKKIYGTENLEYACRTLNSMNAQFSRLREIEALAKAYNSARDSPPSSVKRQPNPHLRGTYYQ
jgi:transposase